MWVQRLSLLEFCKINISFNSLKRHFLFLAWSYRIFLVLNLRPELEASQVRLLFHQLGVV